MHFLFCSVQAESGCLSHFTCLLFLSLSFFLFFRNGCLTSRLSFKCLAVKMKVGLNSSFSGYTVEGQDNVAPYWKRLIGNVGGNATCRNRRSQKKRSPTAKGRPFTGVLQEPTVLVNNGSDVRELQILEASTAAQGDVGRQQYKAVSRPFKQVRRNSRNHQFSQFRTFRVCSLNQRIESVTGF